MSILKSPFLSFKTASIAFALLVTGTTSSYADSVFHESRPQAHCLLQVETTNSPSVIKVRLTDLAEKSSGCSLSQQQTQGQLTEILKATEQKRPQPNTVAIGRLMHWGWMADYLHKQASQSSLWPRNGKIQISASFAAHFTEDSLKNSPMKPVLENFTRTSGFSSFRFSCEKILMDKKHLPIDALCWIAFK